MKLICLFLNLFFTLYQGHVAEKYVLKGLNICLKSEKESYTFGEKIIFHSELENTYEECVGIDVQPFYFIVNSMKKSDMLIIWKQGYFPNYILMADIKKGGIVWVHGDGGMWDGYYDTSIPHDVIIKPKGKIKMKIILDPVFYERYLTEGEWEVILWQACRKFNIKIESNMARYLFKEGVYKKEKLQLEEGFTIETYVVENYFGDEIPKEKKYPRFLIEKKDHHAISNKIKINILSGNLK